MPYGVCGFRSPISEHKSRAARCGLLVFVLFDTDVEPSPAFRSLRVSSTLGAAVGRAAEFAGN